MDITRSGPLRSLDSYICAVATAVPLTAGESRCYANFNLIGGVEAASEASAVVTRAPGLLMLRHPAADVSSILALEHADSWNVSYSEYLLECRLLWQEISMVIWYSYSGAASLHGGSSSHHRKLQLEA